jgi:hypothetical protein
LPLTHGDKVPEGLMDDHDPDHAPEPEDFYEPMARSTLGALLEPLSERFGRCLPTRARQVVPKLVPSGVGSSTLKKVSCLPWKVHRRRERLLLSRPDRRQA